MKSSLAPCSRIPLSVCRSSSYTAPIPRRTSPPDTSSAPFCRHCCKCKLPLDDIVAQGVSTGIMLRRSSANHHQHALIMEIVKFINEIAPDYKKWTEVLSASDMQDLKESARNLWNDASRRLFVIDVGSSLCDANSVAAELQRLAEAPSTANIATVPAEELVGIIVCGAGNWNRLFGHAELPQSLPRRFPMPQQSWTFGSQTRAKGDSEEFNTQGFACWNGQGLARIDMRERMGQIGVRPGEGFLRLDQILNELMSKIGAIPKFGA